MHQSAAQKSHQKITTSSLRSKRNNENENNSKSLLKNVTSLFGSITRNVKKLQQDGTMRY